MEAAASGEELYLKDLGWSPEKVLDARVRMRNLEEDWDSAGMEAYDAF